MRNLVIAAVIVYALAAYFSVGYHHSDEHFQILEFAALKWGINQQHDLAWEYHERMRPAFQPAIVVALHSFYSLFAEPNPFVIITFLRFVTAALSLGAILLFAAKFKLYLGNEKLQRWYILLSLFLWFTVYINVRFSSETWSGSFFLLALSLLAFKKKPEINRDYFLAGLCLGISFLCRYQCAFLIAGLGLWLLIIRKISFIHICILLASFLLVFAAGVLIDFWFYGEWVLTTWKYFEQNILLDKASNFGVEPLWFYISETFATAVPPFSIVYIFATLVYIAACPKSVITWSILPIL